MSILEYHFNAEPDLLMGQVRGDEIRGRHESKVISEQFMVVMSLKDMGKMRGRVELRNGVTCGDIKSTAEQMNLKLKERQRLNM